MEYSFPLNFRLTYHNSCAESRGSWWKHSLVAVTCTNRWGHRLCRSQTRTVSSLSPRGLFFLQWWWNRLILPPQVPVWPRCSSIHQVMEWASGILHSCTSSSRQRRWGILWKNESRWREFSRRTSIPALHPFLWRSCGTLDQDLSWCRPFWIQRKPPIPLVRMGGLLTESSLILGGDRWGRRCYPKVLNEKRCTIIQLFDLNLHLCK